MVIITLKRVPSQESHKTILYDRTRDTDRNGWRMMIDHDGCRMTDLFDHLVCDVDVRLVRIGDHQGVDVTPEPTPHVTCTES